MLVLGLVAYTFVSIVSTHRHAAAVPHSSLKAFYISEGALEIGKKFVADRWATETDVILGTSFAIYTDQTLGEGTFAVWVTETDLGFATFTSYGYVPY